MVEGVEGGQDEGAGSAVLVEVEDCTALFDGEKRLRPGRRVEDAVRGDPGLPVRPGEAVPGGDARGDELELVADEDRVRGVRQVDDLVDPGTSG